MAKSGKPSQSDASAVIRGRGGFGVGHHGGCTHFRWRIIEHPSCCEARTHGMLISDRTSRGLKQHHSRVGSSTQYQRFDFVTSAGGRRGCSGFPIAFQCKFPKLVHVLQKKSLEKRFTLFINIFVKLSWWNYSTPKAASVNSRFRSIRY